MQTIFLFATTTCSIMIVDESHVNVVFRSFNKLFDSFGRLAFCAVKI